MFAEHVEDIRLVRLVFKQLPDFLELLLDFIQCLVCVLLQLRNLAIQHL